MYDFAIRCMNFSSHFEHLICHIKHGEDILLARQMFFRGPAPDVCIKQFLGFGQLLCDNQLKKIITAKIVHPL